MCKKGRKNKVYSPEFKIAAVELMRREKLGYGEVAVLLDISKVAQNGKNQLKLWERIYLEEGPEGLMKERRGRATGAGGSKIGRPPKQLDKAIEDDLIAENQRLRMENEYLKKLHALALSKIESEKGTKPE
jgi:transposase-like protein